MRLRDQITSPARTVHLVLFAASALVFIISCSNVANLILARSVRREGELAIRASLGASASALRRTLLAESLVLCGTSAVLGVAIARPMVAVLAQYAARFSVRARTREFGIRLANGSAPRHLLTHVLGQGAEIACAGIVAGVAGGFALARIAGSYIPDLSIPGALPLVAAATILVGAAILASLVPAARASRVDVIQALRSE